MNSIGHTIIYFDYGGYYTENGDEIRWISRKNQYFTLVLKTSMEEVTYTALVEGIYRKIMVDETTTKLRLSYIPLRVNPKRPSLILDDDDVFGYFMDVNKDQSRSGLHVELIKKCEQNQCFEQLSRDDQGSEVGVRNVRDDRGSEVGEKNKQQLSSGVEDARVDDGIIVADIEGNDNVSCEDDQHDEGDQHINDAWEDGLDLAIGQEFESKQAVQDLIYKAACQNHFDTTAVKSQKNLYVVKCRESKKGCKWCLRVAMHQNSNRFSVRTYNKMHTCSKITTNTSRNRTRKCTPRLIASILHEDYSDKIDTTTPKELVNIVQERFGVKVSYTTAFRAKKKALEGMWGINEGSQ